MARRSDSLNHHSSSAHARKPPRQLDGDFGSKWPEASTYTLNKAKNRQPTIRLLYEYQENYP